MRRDPAFYMIDILIANNKIERYTKEFHKAEELYWSELEWDATIRELEIIGEATNKLIKYGFLPNEKYRKIVDFRNIIVHGYFGIDKDEVWEVIKNKLPIFIDELIGYIKEKNINMNEALYFAKEENSKNPNTIKYLDVLSKKLKE